MWLCIASHNLYNSEYPFDYMDLEFFALKILEWLIGETLGKDILSEAKKKIIGDEFRILGNRALDETIQGNLEYIRILNILRQNGIFEVDDATELDTEEICGTFSGRDKDICCNFFESLKEKYFEVVYELGNKNPLTRFILKNIHLIWQDIRKNREKIEKIEKYIGQEMALDLKKFAELQEEIENQVKKIDDFVGRESFIHDFNPTKPILIEGEVGIGKSYLLMRLTSIRNGQYIPLKIVKDSKTFDLLVTRAKDDGKTLFIDDLDHASEEIKEHILTNVWVAMMTSRPSMQFEREINRIRLAGLEKKDIGKYFKVKGIEIEDEFLERLKEDLSLPIKLRIFVDFLQSRNISYLDSQVLFDISKDIGVDRVILPKGLEDWYDNFVWRDFDPHVKRYPDGAKQAIFAFSLARVPVDITFISKILKTNEETASNVIESLKAFLKESDGFFSLFHESLSLFIRKKLGDPTRLHGEIGDFFSSISYSGHFVPEWEALYHYRIAGEKEKFEEAFNLAVIDLYRHYGFWNEVLENLTFAENCKLPISQTGEFLTEYGLILLFLSKFELSLEKFEGALRIFKEEKNKRWIANTYNHMGSVHASRGDWDKAEEYYEMGLEIQEEIGDKLGMAGTYMNLGSIYTNGGDWDKAEEYCKKGLKIFEEMEDKLMIAGTYLTIGSIYGRKGGLDKAEEYFREGIIIQEEIGDKSGMAGTYMNLGSIFESRGDWDKAEEYYRTSLEIEEEIGNIRAVGQIFSNLGILFEHREHWDKSEKYHERALRIFEEIGDRQGVARTHNNIGSILVHRGNLDKAEEYYRISLEMKEEMGDKEGIANTYSNIGWVYAERGDLEKAEKCYRMALEIEERIGDELGKGQTYIKVGQLKENQGRHQEALVLFEEAKDIFLRLGAKKQVWVALENEFQCHLEMDSPIACIRKLSEMFDNLCIKDTELRIIEYLRNLVLYLFSNSAWELLSRLEEISPSIENLDLQNFVEALSAYGKAKLKRASLNDFWEKSSRIKDENLVEFLDEIVIFDRTWK
jgi:tetratricopeptide (TPR) repeat protein